MPTIIHLQPRFKQHNVERYLKQMKRLLTIATWILPSMLCFSFMALSEMLFLICISNQCTILKDLISLVSVCVSASARQTWVILMYLLDICMVFWWLHPTAHRNFRGLPESYADYADVFANFQLVWASSLTRNMAKPDAFNKVSVWGLGFVQNWISKWISEWGQAHTGICAHQKWKQGLVEPC